MTWIYKNREFTSEQIGGNFGFIYCITNLTNGKFYVGRKHFISEITKPPLKGYKRKRKIKKESNWNSYWSSSAEVKSDVESLGVESFKREILRLCGSKSECAYYEVKYQFDLNVLLENSYNKLIVAKIIKNDKLIESIRGTSQ